MKRFMRFLFAPALTLVLVVPALAQTAPASRPPTRPVKLELVVSKQEGNKKTSTPFLVAGATGVTGQMRIGREVPTAGSAPDGTARTTFQQVGTQIDFLASPNEDGTFKLQLTLTMRAPSGQGQVANFISANTLTLKDGQTTQFSGSDSTGQAITVDVTLTVGK